LIFAGLAVAWLVVLVPMVAKRRQEVLRTADSALASRVLHRSVPVPDRTDHGEEKAVMTDRSATRTSDVQEEAHERPFRPGRGGYDPEAAALAARAKYVFRQRVVIGLLVATIASVALALTVTTAMWSGTAAAVAALIAYLAYLRRQVRIEEEVRRRRAARLANARRRLAPQVEEDEPEAEAEHEPQVGDEPAAEHEPEPSVEEKPAPPPAPRAEVHPRAVAVDLDDEDPVFDELNPSFEPAYRRAAGE